jgi:hypothetical protein
MESGRQAGSRRYGRAHLERAHEGSNNTPRHWCRHGSNCIRRWNAAHGRGLQLAAKQLVRACERLRLSLSRKAGELETFIHVFVDTSLTPNSEQLRTLSALVVPWRVRYSRSRWSVRRRARRVRLPLAVHVACRCASAGCGNAGADRERGSSPSGASAQAAPGAGRRVARAHR